MKLRELRSKYLQGFAIPAAAGDADAKAVTLGVDAFWATVLMCWGSSKYNHDGSLRSCCHCEERGCHIAVAVQLMLQGCSVPQRTANMGVQVCVLSFWEAHRDEGRDVAGDFKTNCLVDCFALNGLRNALMAQWFESQAERLRHCYVRDSVAFLLGRAPDTCHSLHSG